MTKTDWDKYYKNLKKDSKARKKLEKAGRAINIATQISTLREQRGLTQKDLADLVNVSQPAIARLESVNYKGYSLKTLDKIARAFDTVLKISFVQGDISSTLEETDLLIKEPEMTSQGTIEETFYWRPFL